MATVVCQPDSIISKILVDADGRCNPGNVSKFKPWMATGRDRIEWLRRSTRKEGKGNPEDQRRSGKGIADQEYPTRYRPKVTKVRV